MHLVDGLHGVLDALLEGDEGFADGGEGGGRVDLGFYELLDAYEVVFGTPLEKATGGQTPRSD